MDRNKLRCLCLKYHNLKFCVRDKMVLHLYYKGFDEYYAVWTSHDETYGPIEESLEDDINPYKRLVVEELGLEFQKLQPNVEITHKEGYDVHESPNTHTEKFYSLLKAVDEPLWEGCRKHTKLSTLS